MNFKPIKLKIEKDKRIYGVFRLDIHNKPGWFLIQSYKDENDAVIHCDMLNQDTNMYHEVFYYEDTNDEIQ